MPNPNLDLSNPTAQPAKETEDGSPWLPGLLLGAILFLLSMALINWLAYWWEGAVGMLYLLPLWLGTAGWLAHLLLTLPRQLIVADGALTLRWWWRSKTIPVTAITEVRRSRYNLVISTADTKSRLSVLSPNASAHLLTWLEAWVPIAAAARQARMARPLPISLSPQLTAPLITGCMALIFAAIGGLLLWDAWQASSHGDEQSTSMASGALGLLFAAITVLLAYMLIDSYIWRITFDHDTITLRHTLFTERYASKLVTEMALIREEQEIKGFVRQIYKLRISLMDGTELDIAPNLPNFPMDYAGAEEARCLAEVQALLEHHYIPVVTMDLDPATIADSRWGTPQSAYQWQIRPFDLSVTRLDYGEHHAAASNVHLLVGHAEAGAMRFRTTNGEIRVSPDGRYIVIFDRQLLIAFNLANGRTYHRHSRRGWDYFDVRLVAETVVIEEVKRANAQQREPRKPISLERPTSALRRGFGSAEGGTFPSAYGGPTER